MPRKASRRVPLMGALSVLLLLLVAAGGYTYVHTFLTDPYRAIPSLPMGSYIENSQSLRGNIYRFEGIVENELSWSAKQGRMFSFRSDSEGKAYYVAALLPTEQNVLNVQKGQRFEIKVKVVAHGLLQVVEMRKV